MPKKIHLKPHDTVTEWHNNIKRVRNNGHKLKMLVIEKIMSNRSISAKEVQKMFFISPRTMYDWVNQYNENGLNGLIAENPKGRGSGKGNSKYSDEVFVALKEEMAKSDKKWSSKEKKHYLKEKFDIEPSSPTINDGLKRI